MCGTTPNNIALALQTRLQPKKVIVVSGLSLPMLYRVINYSHLNIDELAEKALSGGREGVILFED